MTLSMQKKKKMYPKKNIRNVSWATNQHIGMIYKAPCDTEDISNDAENSALRHRYKLHFK